MPIQTTTTTSTTAKLPSALPSKRCIGEVTARLRAAITRAEVDQAIKEYKEEFERIDSILDLKVLEQLRLTDPHIDLAMNIRNKMSCEAKKSWPTSNRSDLSSQSFYEKYWNILTPGVYLEVLPSYDHLLMHVHPHGLTFEFELPANELQKIISPLSRVWMQKPEGTNPTVDVYRMEKPLYRMEEPPRINTTLDKK